MWRLIYAIPLWILYVCLFLVLVVIGWPLVIIAALLEAYEVTDQNYDKPKDGPIYHFTWPWMFLWDNFEDGIANKNYYTAPNLFLQILYWYNRNPVNNLRITPILSLVIDPKRVRWVGSFRFGAHPMVYDNSNKLPMWFLCWCGPYICYRRQYWRGNKLIEFWVGWRIWPADSLVEKITSASRARGSGFTMQWRTMYEKDVS
jgi:hypothetical protein